jgi:hypothetical protein
MELSEMTALEFINVIRPTHDRTSCSDTSLDNGFYSRTGRTWHGRCTRCMYLEILKDKGVPESFDPQECYG